MYAAALIIAGLPASADGFYAGFGFSNVTAKAADWAWTSFNGIGLGGYEFNEYISVEGEASFVISDGSFNHQDLGPTAIGSKHMGAFVKFALPTSGAFTPHARLGYIRGEAAIKGDYASKSNDTAFSYGVGAEYDFGSSSIRADYSVADFGAELAQFDVLSITNVWKF